nr:ribbon-helix-helix domain-containing protein [uncultured Rhodopila sp.]
MPSDTIRLTASVSKDTDIAVRSFLAQRGMKKGDLSRFIEDAVEWRVLEQTMAEARGKFSDLTPEALDELIDEAVTATRQINQPWQGRLRRAAGHRHPCHDQHLTRRHLAAGVPDRALARKPVRPIDLG